MSEWPLIPAGIAVLTGCGLIALGLCAPRRGDGRFCRRCRYNLAGLTSQRCPECGSDLAARGAVVLGQRSIRRKPVAGGFILLLIGTPLLLGVAGRAVWDLHWWHWAPSELLIRAASSGSGAARQEAARRIRTPDIDPAAAARILEAGTKVSLSVRKRLVCGEFHPARIILDRWPEMINEQVWVDAEVLALRIDGQAQRIDPYANVWRRQALIIEDPGEHVLELEVRVFTTFSWDRAPYEFQRTLRTTVTAVAPGAIDDVELVRSADIDEQLADGIGVESLNLAAVCEDVWWTARLRGAPPIDLALRVEAVQGGKRIWIGDVTFQKVRPRMARWLRCAPRKSVEQAFGVLPERCDLIFRGDKSAARATSDLTRVWGGEIRVKDVPLSDSLWGK